MKNFPENDFIEYYKKNIQLFLQIEKIEKYGSSPDKVTDTIFHVINSKNPKLKILVGRNAKMTHIFERILSSSLFHSMFGRQLVKR